MRQRLGRQHRIVRGGFVSLLMPAAMAAILPALQCRAALTQPVGLSPAGKDGYACSDTSTAYSWNGVAGASWYRVQWMIDLIRPPIAEETVAATVCWKTLSGSGRRYWRVRAETSGETGPWSAIAEFALRATPGQVGLVSPAVGTQVCSGIPQRYSWDPAADATRYRIQWDTRVWFPAPEEATVTTAYADQALSGSGAYWYWRVRGETDSCEGAWSETWGVNLPVALVQPVPNAPAEGSVVCSGVWTAYSWQAVAGATSYRVQWSASGAFASPVEMFTADTSVQQALTGLGTRYWRVNASNNCGTGPWSATRTVQLAIVPGTPVLLEPADGAAVCGAVAQRYCWTEAAGAHLYRIQWDDDPAFGSPIEMSPTAHCADSVLAGGSWWWRVRAESPCGASAWSSSRAVAVEELAVPPTPAVIGPDGAYTVCAGTRVDFCWETAPAATRYRIQWDETRDFAGAEEAVVAGTCTHRTFAATGGIYWRVRAENVCGSSGWTEARRVEFAVPAAIGCTEALSKSDNKLHLAWEDAGCSMRFTVEVTDDPASANGWTPLAPVDQWPVATLGWTGAAPAGPRSFLRVRGDPFVAVPNGMVTVPGGTFPMGDTFGEGDRDELPPHDVVLSPFSIDQTEVTKALWDDVLGWAVSQGHGRQYAFESIGRAKAADHPVQEIYWYDAAKWCNARSEKEGLTPCYYTDPAKTTVYRTGQVDLVQDWVRWDADGYRLPTEAEWECAARGGAAGGRFPWSYTNTVVHALANYQSSTLHSYDVSPTRGYHPDYDTNPTPYTSPVGSFSPHGRGLYDMAGNVREWCWDWYDGNWYGNPAATDPDTRGPAGPLTSRVMRGGTWASLADELRCAARDPMGPAWQAAGFRCVRRQ